MYMVQEKSGDQAKPDIWKLLGFRNWYTANLGVGCGIWQQGGWRQGGDNHRIEF